MSGPSNSALNNRITKKHGWIVQKYMEKPFLVNSRKFDVRVFVLFVINKEKKIDVHMFNEPYIRTSAVPYTTDKKSVR